jgi:hypothetical protein
VNRFVAAALMWGAVTLGSCSSEQLRGASNDASADTPATLDLQVDRCSGNLSEVGRECQASFDGSLADLPACSGIKQTVWRCGDLIAIAQGSGFTGLTCYYDAAAHLLVGALEWSDAPGFCGDSFARFGGQIPGPSCDTVAPFYVRGCSRRDGGSD